MPLKLSKVKANKSTNKTKKEPVPEPEQWQWVGEKLSSVTKKKKATRVDLYKICETEQIFHSLNIGEWFGF